VLLLWAVEAVAALLPFAELKLIAVAVVW